MWISPRYSQAKTVSGRIEDKIDVYEDRVLGWFLNQGRFLERESSHAGFVILEIALGYLEGHAIYLLGKDSGRQSREFFKIGFKEVFRELEKRFSNEVVENGLGEVYEQARCGLFHDGMTRNKVVMSGDYDHPVSFVLNEETKEVMIIQINPHKFLDAVLSHFIEYVRRLRDPSELKLRKNFEKAWNLKNA